MPRVINGTDAIQIGTEFAGLPEAYEPDVWSRVMKYARPGARIADVGANIGLYTMALAKRVGPGGKVWAFEPDPANAAALRLHAKLNGVNDRVILVEKALGACEATLKFNLAGLMSSIQSAATQAGTVIEVPQITLDQALGQEGLDVLKIDVEGYEEEVLKGATILLSDPTRKPEVIFIEVHPYAWKAVGTTTESLKARVASAGYRLEMVNGQPLGEIDFWGEIIALKI